MFFWFLGASFVAAWAAFRTPTIDYRLVMLGAVLPLADAVTGGLWMLHSLLASVVAMTVVMLATRGTRLRRRQLLGVPIGMFFHLVADGVWARAEAFWWPFMGLSFGDGDSRRLPEISRGLGSFVLEVVGLGALFWCYRRFGLDDPVRRDLFRRTGQLARDLTRDRPPATS